MPSYRWLSYCLLGCLFLIPTGCSVFPGVSSYLQYNDMTNDFVLGYRNDVWAAESWHANKHAYFDQAYFADFGAGYRAGYADVAAGGKGCPPAVPPRSYWTWKYQTAEGQAKVAAWYAGYPHGAAAAEQDGAGNWSNIQVADHIKKQYSPEFQNGTIYLQQGQLRELSQPANAYPLLQDEQPAGIMPQQESPVAAPVPAPPPVQATDSARMFRQPWQRLSDHSPPNSPSSFVGFEDRGPPVPQAAR